MYLATLFCLGSLVPCFLIFLYTIYLSVSSPSLQYANDYIMYRHIKSTRDVEVLQNLTWITKKYMVLE